MLCIYFAIKTFEHRIIIKTYLVPIVFWYGVAGQEDLIKYTAIENMATIIGSKPIVFTLRHPCSSDSGLINELLQHKQ